MYRLEVWYHWEMFLLPLPLATNQLNPPGQAYRNEVTLQAVDVLPRLEGWIQPTELAMKSWMIWMFPKIVGLPPKSSWWMPFFLVVTLCSGPPPWFRSSFYIATKLRFPRRIRPFWSFGRNNKNMAFFQRFDPKIQFGALRAQTFSALFFWTMYYLKKKKPLETQGGKFFWPIFEVNQREPPWFIRSEAAP